MDEFSSPVTPSGDKRDGIQLVPKCEQEIQFVPKGEQEIRAFRVIGYPDGRDLINEQQLFQGLVRTYREVFATTWGEGYIVLSEDYTTDQYGEFSSWLVSMGFSDISEVKQFLDSNYSDTNIRMTTFDQGMPSLFELFAMYKRETSPSSITTLSKDLVYIKYLKSKGVNGRSKIAELENDPLFRKWVSSRSGVELEEFLRDGGFFAITPSIQDLELDDEFCKFIISNNFARYYPPTVPEKRFTKYLSTGSAVLLVRQDNNEVVGFTLGEIREAEEIFRDDILPHLYDKSYPFNTILGKIKSSGNLTNRHRLNGLSEKSIVFNAAELGILERYQVGMIALQLVSELMRLIEDKDIEFAIGWTSLIGLGKKPTFAAFLISLGVPMTFSKEDQVVIFAESIDEIAKASRLSPTKLRIVAIKNLLIRSINPEFRPYAIKVLRTLLK